MGVDVRGGREGEERKREGRNKRTMEREGRKERQKDWEKVKLCIHAFMGDETTERCPQKPNWHPPFILREIVASL